jgi:Zn-dependent hydrolases, including glyoxylases
MRLGDMDIIALSDGTAPQDLLKLLTNRKPGEVERISAANYQTTTIECSVNVYLLKTAGKLILIDAGTSNIYGPQLGHLRQSLANAGYKPEQIDAVLLTHIHMDHIGGIIDRDTPIFPNATVYISSEEASFWLNPANKNKAAKEQVGFFDGAQLKLAPIQKLGKLKTFEFGKELFPGITPLAGLGHTPGHTFYQVESGRDKILFVGDILVSQPVQFASPQISSIYDLNPQQSIDTRIEAFKAASTNGYWVAISHASFPGIGHIGGAGKSFRWIPINYSSKGVGQ